jgi:hypothetical protein
VPAGPELSWQLRVWASYFTTRNEAALGAYWSRESVQLDQIAQHQFVRCLNFPVGLPDKLGLWISCG